MPNASLLFIFPLTVTLPPDPPPITIKSYSSSMSRENLSLGRLHGSSKSHCERMKTSSRPMNNMNWPPPHKVAKVCPADAAPMGQSQVTIVSLEIRRKSVKFESSIVSLIGVESLLMCNTKSYRHFNPSRSARVHWHDFSYRDKKIRRINLIIFIAKAMG